LPDAVSVDTNRCRIGSRLAPLGPADPRSPDSATFDWHELALLDADVSALGRMMRLLARCSNTCAAQPVRREHTKIGVNSLVGMPMKWYAEAW
jgi:hypothetical protein